jgi:hypothetical protein
MRRCEGPAEQISCGYLNFFATPATASQRASQHPEVTGSVLKQDRAAKLGAQTFGSLLGDPVAAAADAGIKDPAAPRRTPNVRGRKAGKVVT